LDFSFATRAAALALAISVGPAFLPNLTLISALLAIASAFARSPISVAVGPPPIRPARQVVAVPFAFGSVENFVDSVGFFEAICVASLDLAIVHI
jgi:hypothetical protein